jgi:hypothetical protein
VITYLLTSVVLPLFFEEGAVAKNDNLFTNNHRTHRFFGKGQGQRVITYLLTSVVFPLAFGEGAGGEVYV